jgi:hypothetical protein
MLVASMPRTLAMRPKQQQMKLYGNEIKLESGERCHIAIADFICSNALPFSLSK